MKPQIACAIAFLLASFAYAETKTFKTGHVTVNYAGITEPQAKSLGVVADAARKSALDRFGFDVPDQITVNVDCKLGNTVRLFTDGNDTYTLSIRTGFDLAPPAACGIHNLYGMCHELGHVVMYRPMKNATQLLTHDACEGFAHYFGSRVVDDVFAALGENAWWQPYDYRAEGMMRLNDQLKSASPSGVDQAAGMWMELAQIVGEKNLAKLFVAWNKVETNAVDPAAELLAVMNATTPNDKLAAWWKTAAPALVKPSRRSNFAPASKPVAAAAGKPTELALDDGKSAGKKSIAGSGHAVAFEAPADGCKLTAVKIFGSRYGTQQPPADDFHVFLCDSDGKQIKDFPFPYKNFLRGGDRWVTLKFPEPTEVPKNFILCAVFNPTQTKGVFVHYDAKVDGDSRTGLPGELNDAFDKGDWMIRAVITEPAPQK